jgi:hypothetical protein
MPRQKILKLILVIHTANNAKTKSTAYVDQLLAKKIIITNKNEVINLPRGSIL